MSSQHLSTQAEELPLALPSYQSILLAVDSSDHANRGTSDAIELARLWGARITAAHVYAAKLHDHRFRQMEGGLPEQFREEEELERQRDVHDDLITRGLSIITDSYLDQSERECEEAGLEFVRRSLEGKNYREMTRETNSGPYDLLVMGSLGLGAVKGSRLGTVTSRVARRSDIDTLVIKQPKRSISEGPIVVAIDGSPRSYGGLLSGIALSKAWNVPLHVISAFDPYYHYVAFNRIASVLSEEAGKVFKFQEQEKLHEEIIDSGLAKIYQGHLDVAQSIADEQEIEITTVLLDGKPHDAIEKYLNKITPSLLIIGKLGIHADEELDIGGNSELLLQNCDCAILLSQREFQPRVELLAEVTTSWTHEAEKRMENVPSFVRNMARMAILRFAQEQGHTVITESIVEEATAQLMPGHAEQAMGEIVEAYDKGELKRKPGNNEAMRWSEEATARLRTIDDLSLRGNLSMRAEKKARAEKSKTVEAEHIAAFLDDDSPAELHWQAAALARLARVPEGFMRGKSKERIEEYAVSEGIGEISLAVAEAGLAEARKAMESAMTEQPSEKKDSICPFANMKQAKELKKNTIKWSAEAEERMLIIPEGFMRDLTRQRVEKFARKHECKVITVEIIEEKYQEWGAGSAKQQSELEWDESAWQRLQRIPDFIRGMVMLEVERCARELGEERVTNVAVDKASGTWKKAGGFHSEGNPNLYKDDTEE